MELESGRVAVVTGAGSGIGFALADRLARAGCSLVLADVQVDALEHAAATIHELGVETMAIRTDVSNNDQVLELAQATIDRFGAIHIVCNNAGVAGGGDPWLGPLEGWEWVMGVNFWGVVYGVKAFLPHIVASGGGHIVNTASMAGLYPGFSPAYDASKHAVVALTEGLYHNIQSARMPIGVSCLCPGWVKTGIIDADRNWPGGDLPELTTAQQISRDHVKRAVAEGMPPAAVADKVLEAIRSDRFWVFPHPDFLELAVERFHRIGDGGNPVLAEQMPGMPTRTVMMNEMMEAMADEAGTD